VLLKTTALGGAERLVWNTLPHLDRESFRYGFAAFDGAGPLARACAEAGHPFRALPRAGDPRALLALRRMLRRERIDLVHAHLPVPACAARLAARGLPTRVVYTEHTTQDVYRAPSRALNAWTYGWQEAVVAVAGCVRASAEARIGRAARERIAVVANGVDLEVLEAEASRALRPEPPRRAGAFHVLVPASLVPVKGHADLLAALARLPEEGPPVEVWLAGDGPLRETLALRARAPVGPARVHLLGQRRDVFALMRAADAVALPSRAEGLPLAVLEALALGRPLVATAVGGIPEVVADGETGRLAAARDPDALARALDALRRDPGLRARLGRAAARAARARFDVRDTVRKVEEVYRRALAAPRRQGRWSSRSLT